MDQLFLVISRKLCWKLRIWKRIYFVSSLYRLFSDFECPLWPLKQGFFLHGFSKTQAPKNSKIEEFLKTQAIFVQKLKGWRHVYIVTMTSSGQNFLKNSRNLLENSIFRLFAKLSIPHKCTKKSPALAKPRYFLCHPWTYALSGFLAFERLFL